MDGTSSIFTFIGIKSAEFTSSKL